MPTIKDIAKAAGVSHGTVSNVLNKRPGVSYEKIRLVEQTAIALGYSIDEKASLLRRGTTRTIAVILPTITERHYCDLYTGILRYAQSQKYTVRLFLTDDLPYIERRIISEALALKVCSVIAVSCLDNHAKEYEAIISKKIPLLFLIRPTNDASLCSFSYDMELAARQIASKLSGRKNICVLTNESYFSDQAAFRDALKKHLSLSDTDFYENRHGEQSPVVYTIMQRPILPEAVICSNETLADKVQRTFAESGLPVPDIIALSSLRPSHNALYHNFKLNYRMLGHDAAVAVIGKVEKTNELSSRTFPVSGYSKPFSSPAVIRKKPLRLLAHQTPAIAALGCLLPHFRQRYGIPVELYACSMEEFFERILSDDGTQWDIVRLDPSTLSYLGPRVLRNLNELDTDAHSQFCQFLPNLQNDFSTVGGKLYAYPFDISVQMLFYHRSVFEDIGQIRAFYEETGNTLQIPATYQEFDRICRFFSRAYRPDSPIPYGASLPPANPTSVANDYLPRLLSAGGLLYSVNGCLNLNTSIALRTLKEYIEYASLANPTHVHDWSEIAENFLNGRSATAILYVNHASSFVRAQSANVGIEIGYAPIPGGHPLLAGGSLGVHVRSEQPEEAYQFIRWATGEDIAPEMVMLGGVSACRNVYEQREILDTYPWLEALPGYIQMGIRKPILSTVDIDYNQRDFEYMLGEHLILAITGKETPEEALLNTQKVLDGIR